MKLLLAALLCALGVAAHAQPVQYPVPWPSSATTMGTITITAGGTFQSVIAAPTTPTPRRGCLIQNTSVRTMYVYVGANASATTSNSFQLQPGATFSCNFGTAVVQENISVTTSATSDTGIYAVQ